MFCNKCGNKVEEGTVFCTSCGNKIVTEEVKPVVEEPVVNNPVPVKKKNNTFLKILLLIVTLGFLTSVTFLLINLFGNKGGSSDSSIVANSTWYAGDESEMIFGDDRLYWYKDAGVHDDNYYSGKYKFYIGKEAVDFITTELSSYDVTKTELTKLFNRNSNYDESNFVVIDINYDKYVLDGKDMTISRPRVPLYGFILKNNTYLDVANMNTGTYYEFTKK